MGDQNLVLKRHVDPTFVTQIRDATETIPLELTPYDLPYYFVRVVPGRPLREQVFGPDPNIKIRVTNWLRMPNPVLKAGPVRAELEFLEGLGLAFMVPNSEDVNGGVTFAISPLTRMLYADGTGVFRDVNTERDTKALRYIRLLIDYVLPGIFWRNYYATHGLAPHIHLSEHLGREMIEIAKLWDELSSRYGAAAPPLSH